MNYISIDRVLAKFERDYGIGNTSESDLIEWVGEALETMGTVKSYEEAVAFIEVINGQADLPNGFHAIIQIGRNNCFTPVTKNGICPSDIVSAITNPTIEPGPYRPILLDCQGQPLELYNLAYYRPYFDLRWEYDQYRRYTYNSSCFSPVELSNSTLYDSIVCKMNDMGYSHGTPKDKFTVIKNSVIRFSFQEGQIALSYLRQVVDEESGYPLVPEDYSALTAITEYLSMKKAKRDFQNGRDGSKGRMDKAEADFQWYCGQARSKAIMPKTVDEFENIKNQRNYIIPRTTAYSSFFGKLSTPENRAYNNPNGIRGHLLFRGQ